MATFFGEVKYLVSRAYDEADDDEESPGVTYDVRLELSAGGQGKLDSAEALLVSYGTLVTDFCETLVASEQCEEVGRVFVEAQNSPTLEDTGDFHPRKPVPSPLFLTPSSLLVCCVSKDVTAAVAPKFSRKLLSLTKSSCMVMVLSSHHYDALKASYSPQGEDNCVVHSLRSSTFPHTPVYPQLPQPAILDSVPAAVLTECVVGRRPCVAYPVFTETYSTGDLDLVAGALQRVFQGKPFQKYVPVGLDTKKLHQYRTTNPRRDNLDLYL
ncbi:Proteasome assembly chaperone 1 [Chionoecetes opilio]|uniref:Proteasome assembly chaperone 1 n=1 Tax=Chionoecetes opilio TaxID=41210 RepID=A0A8J5BY84_CHIOP|nr:Proteasome assembly chaperone 1 [Chionoecetes opilio]